MWQFSRLPRTKRTLSRIHEAAHVVSITKGQTTRGNPGLKIISGLNAADELGQAAVEIVAGNIQVAACPRSTEIPAGLKS
jgi:hypothetical protein